MLPGKQQSDCLQSNPSHSETWVSTFLVHPAAVHPEHFAHQPHIIFTISNTTRLQKLLIQESILLIYKIHLYSISIHKIQNIPHSSTRRVLWYISPLSSKKDCFMNFQKIKSKKKILKKNSALGALISSFGFGLREKTSPASDSTSKSWGRFRLKIWGIPTTAFRRLAWRTPQHWSRRVTPPWN